jgi:hypothetical protein
MNDDLITPKRVARMLKFARRLALLQTLERSGQSQVANARTYLPEFIAC